MTMKSEAREISQSKETSPRGADLSQARLALLEKWLKGEKMTGLTAIPRRKGQDRVPLSFAQQRLWFIDKLVPGTPAYNVPCAVELIGPLDTSVFENCLNEIVRRHEALRTTFPAEDGEPYQIVAPSLTVPLEVIELNDYPEEERESRALEMIHREEQKPFDLVNGPLLRTTLIRVGEEHHIFQLTLHHIICDGWSTTILVREVTDLYEAFSAGRPSPLPELAIQYPDFAYWQRDWLKGERLQAQLAYWKEQLADPPILELPADRPRPAIQNLEGARHYFDIPPATAKAIKSLGNREGATTFMILLAALATLFYRYTGQEDIVVGIPIANRNRPEIEGLIGFFANTLVLRTSLAGNPTFRELLNRVNRTTVGAYDNQDLPFEWLVGELQPERDMSRNPLFQIMFTHQNWKSPPSNESSRLRYKVLETRKSVSLFDLWWGVWNVGADLQSAIEYSTDLYDTTTIIRIQNHFLTLLQEVVADPEQPISAVQILTPEERHQLLVEWNDTAVDYPADTLLHEKCEEQARLAPDSIAVVFEEQQLSYGELNTRANQLARYLKKRCVEPGDVVAICMERSPELMTGLLAILKAGAAYLPLDPRDPAERILNILNDSRSRLLLTREHLIKEIPFAALKNLPSFSRDIEVTPPRPQILDLDSLPLPDRTLVDYGRYNRYFAQGLVKEVINLVATRGCPFNCFYCHKIWPKRHVSRSAGNIFEEIKCHYDKGYRTFSIVDDIFNLDRRNSEAFFELVIQNNLKIRILFPSGLRGDILTPDYIDLMSEAGTMMAALALETASPRVQKLIKKNLNIEKLRENLEYICLKHPHLVLELFTMFGFPTETEEEVLMTFDFIKSIRWLHFPYLNALKIFPNTEMARLALEHGVSPEAIVQFSNLSYNQLGDTLPFSKSFARQYQANFMKEYFLNPERLRSVIFYQKQVLSPEEIVAKYENYLPGGLKSYPEIMDMIENIGTFSRPAAPPVSLEVAPAAANGSGGGVRILLLDLSLLFSREAEGDVYNPYNPIDVPIGLMYLMTHLKRRFGDRIQGRVMKSMVDFDSYDDLKGIIRDFQPRIIGFRGLSLYKDFFHKTVTLVRQWHPEAVVIAGGPYTTSEYNTLLADRNIDLAVLGEGETTFADLIGKVLENGGDLPEESVLKEIPGLAFLPRQLPVPVEQAVPGRDILMANRLAEEISRENTENLPRPIEVADPAYVIYTSGSTGEPKGVVNTHRGIVNRLFWMQDAYRLNREDSVMQKTPYTFDVSVWELFWPLMTGSRLVLARPEGHKDPAYMIRLINRQRITTIHFVPSMLRLFLEEEEVGTCTGLKRVICSGEELPLALKERFLSSLNAELHNLYGPTEAAVDVTSWACRSDYERPAVPIGRPIANMQIYLLDRYLNPVPIGVPGELHIGGVGLATGYIGRPHLTEEKFIPHPFSDEPGARLYKTGDLARYLPDGNIEFLGRIDFQVKIRGVRIELGEIEAVLRQHPVLRDAAVLSREPDQTPGHKQLVAYIIPDQEERGLTGEESGEELSAEQIHDWQKVFDRTYGESGAVDDPAFNILGWNNSYTGLPFPREEMAEWVVTTVERIRSLKPGRVLEIGCGTGLLLFRLAPDCREYYATDFSAAALDYVQRQLDKPGQALPQVRLFQKMAGEFADLPRNHFDTVILNSVVQYFPGIDFLLDLIRECVELVGPRGAIFLGDIRSLPLLEAFYTSVELERAPLSLSTAELKQRVKRRIAQEKELVVHPAFFTALQQELPRIGHVEIQLKRGRFHNEMTSFRYDVTLHIGLETETVDETTWLDWQEEDLNMNALEQRLRQNGPGLLGVTGVPNTRVLPARRTMDLLAGLERPVSVEQLQKRIQDIEPAPGVDPEEWWELCRQLPYSVEVYNCEGEMNSHYSVLLRRADHSPAAPLKVPAPDCRFSGDGRAWSAYANNPLHEKITLKLIPELRRYLKDKMSEYLIPSAFVLMDAWPLTPNGKLDRQALPAPFQRAAEKEEDYVAPRNMVEERLANIWAQVLGLDQVGIHSNFFELGGDSIHSIWVVARANKAGIQITPQQIFQNQTIADLAGVAVAAAEGQPAAGREPGVDTAADVQPFELAGLDRGRLDQLLTGFPAEAVEDIYPLAPYQQHILNSMLSGSEATFVFQRLNRMTIPDFDIPRLETALQGMVALRPALRSSFAWEDLEEPLQVVHKQGDVPVTVEDWRDIPEEDQLQKLEAGAEAERSRGFSLTEPSAIRLLIARANDEDYYIIMTGSYIRGDGWSLEIAFADAIRHYGALSAGREVEHQPLPPFSRYIAWLRRQSTDDVETFWRHNLEGFTRPTPLVKKAPGNTPGRQKGLQRQHLYLSAEATASVQTMAQKHRLTLNTVLQGAWAVLLSRYTGSDDVVFGVTLSGRTINLPGVETIPGPLFNTLPLRIAVPDGVTLIPWLEGIMAQQAEMNQYGYSHLDRIHDWCGLASGVHLFESFIVFQNLRGTLNSGQNSRQVHQLYTQMDFPLRIDIFPQTEMGLVMTYHGRSFTDQSITRILEDYRALLESMAADPQQSPAHPLLP